MSHTDNKAVIPLRVLVVEDSEDDTMLVLREIRKGGYEPLSERVETGDTLRDALARQQWDLVISDFSMPNFSAISALKIVRERDPELPFILVSGTITEETAVNAMKAGAHDYVTKGNMARLVPAIEREMRDARVRREGRRMEKELEAYHADLEKKVEERTWMLARANAQLLAEIAERQRAEESLRESEKRYRMLFNAIDEGFCIIEVIFDEKKKPIDYRYLEINPSFEKQTGLIDVLGKRMRELSPKHEEHWYETYGKIALTGQPDRFQNRAEQLHRWYDVFAFRFGLPKDRQVAVLFNDITERKRMEEEIKHLAHHDSLTGLPNRRLFRDLLELEIQQALRNRTKLAILFLDLDRFKEINDTLGHEVGDQLLKQAADRFRQAIRKSDTVARIGGDEFNVILADIGRPEDISDIAQKIIDRFRSPFFISGQELNVTTSIGISVFSDDSAEIDSLLRYADIAMYYAKESGRNTYRFYNPTINVLSLERMRFENSLRQAIERDEFRLYFQPVVDIKSNRIVSAEALLRWQHPDQGLLEPGKFFRAAEDIGFMPKIDEWVLTAAGRQIRKWMKEGASPVCVNVNISAREFENQDLSMRIRKILDETGAAHGCLDIEITETTAMGNVESTITRLRELAEMGVKVSIDDFGTGYSSLNQLKRLPIRKLKLDRSFVRDIATDTGNRTIVTAVLLMAHAMNLKVVAEGVEGENQLAFLRALHCDEAQGFYFSRPLPAEKFRELVMR